ncbi:MAG TPA: type II toxin-antitoxin system HicB family antitoxin [Stellaceae bacterium]|nr:type II toxin-antitoxin system HicB family antitoxin [Stellaceae bacterium]
MRATVFAYPATLTRDAARRFLVRFPDIPEALTDGATEEEALREAADALSEALMSRIADGEAIPEPSPIGRNQYQVAPDATVALKAALNKALKEKRATAADLSRLLDIDHKEARRLLDPRETSKVPRLTAALAALGYSVTTAVYDAAKRERILSSPAERKTGTLRPRKRVKGRGR